MSTRSYVGVVTNKGIKAAYVHYDGYLEGVGQDLISHFNSFETALKAVDFPEKRTLFEQFDDVEYYSNIFKTENEFEEVGENFWVDYLYLFKNNKWYYKKLNLNSEWVEVEIAIQKGNNQ